VSGSPSPLRARKAWAQLGVSGRERVGVMESPHRDALDCMGSYSRIASRCSRVARESAPGSMTISLVDSRVASDRRASRHERGPGRESGSASARAAADGNRCVTPPTSSCSGVPSARARSDKCVCTTRRGRCCSSAARRASSSPETQPGTRTPGACADEPAERQILGECLGDGERVGVEVRRCRQRATAAARSRRLSRRSGHLTERAPGVRSTTPGAAWEGRVLAATFRR
jgi:hypothetical protein